MRAGKTMRGRRDDEDDDRPLSLFLAFSRAFLSSGVPECALEGRGWPGLAGWMKAQIRAKTRIRGRDWADLRRPDKKNACRGPRRECEWRYSKSGIMTQPKFKTQQPCSFLFAKTPTR
jgi:hypothetical protein